jgi:hypothetical protein
MAIGVRFGMDRATKLAAVASAAAALTLHANLASRAYAIVFPLSMGAFVASAMLSAVLGESVVAVVLFATYLVPALFLTLTGFFTFSHFVVWQAALFGVMAPRMLRLEWAFPKPWKGPLVFWVLAIALSWPIIVAREFDFTTALLANYRLWSSRAGIPPPVAVAWILNVTCIALVGLIWFDWLFDVYAGDRVSRFRAHVLWPLFGGCVIGSAVAVYQAFGHTGFLNPTLYGVMGRAAGTMLDGNVFGTVTAMWLPFAAALAFRAIEARGWRAAGWLALPAGLGIALLATGSRTALLTAVAGAACLLAGAWPTVRAHRARALLVAGALAVVIVGAALFSPASTTSALTRVQWLIPTSSESLHYVVREVWDRAGYGTIAARMIAEHPFVGVGIGNFSLQVADVAHLTQHRVMVPDNAQNWYRHQLAETGLLGSVGWIVWTGLVVWLLIRRRSPRSDAVSAQPDRPSERHDVGAAKGALVGLGVTSLLGMPTQDAAVTLTFIGFAFWCIRLIDDGATQRSEAKSRLSRTEWSVLAGVLACFLGATAYVAWNELRPPYRGLRADWNYQYGFWDDPLLPQPFRWTEGKAVDVFPVDRPWLKLVLGTVAPDANQRPVEVKVWRNHDLILRLNRRSDFPVTRYVRVPEGQDRMMIEIEVSRTWKPAGVNQRERGVAVAKWELFDVPPPREIGIP